MTEDEQRFWDAAFCAAISGGMAITSSSRGTSFYPAAAQDLARNAAIVANAALTARRARMEK